MTSEDKQNLIAYFSMEIALHPSMPTYSGGLGILAGDTLRAAADLGMPMVAVTLLHRKGYFQQHLDAKGVQTETPEVWQPEKLLKKEAPIATIPIDGRTVHFRAWRYDIEGNTGEHIQVYLLDTDLPENTPEDRALTDYLYGGDDRYRLCQEMILGIGGVQILRLLEHKSIQAYHMNEGHSALLTLALLEQQMQLTNSNVVTDDHIEAVRKQCIFTTHTPVPAGHDKFSWEMVAGLLGALRATRLRSTDCCLDNSLNMTFLALRFSHYINGVAMSHGEVSKGMYPGYHISSITNGVHAGTWISEPFQQLFDAAIPDWRHDNRYLRYTVRIPLEQIRNAHAAAKRTLFNKIKETNGVDFKEDVFTIGFARRATAYKRADLLFADKKRLLQIVKNSGPIQIIFAGKAHPRDLQGKALIEELFEIEDEIKQDISMVYVENYDMAWAKLITSGVDLWLNTPMRPLEASGTSGMKATLNGVPSLSILDGWWVEGHVEGKTGWSIGEADKLSEDSSREAQDLYDKLENVILPLYYKQPDAFAEVMRYTISINGSFFNTQRMVRQYFSNAYYPATLTPTETPTTS